MAMGFTNFSSILGERKTLPNHLELPFDILKMIYHLILEDNHRMLLLCLGYRRFSTAYTLGLGVLNIKLRAIFLNDAEVKGMLIWGMLSPVG